MAEYTKQYLKYKQWHAFGWFQDNLKTHSFDISDSKCLKLLAETEAKILETIETF